MSIKTDLIEIFRARQAGPFLFLGSGFSIRYLGLEDWKGLLSRFCITGKPFAYYLASADGDYPTLANLLAEDFNKYWWEAEEFKASIKENESKIEDVTSALRIEISNYLSQLDKNASKGSYSEEIKLLSALNVDGVITTNWDVFIEQLFPDYKVYIGQEELLFSNPQEIGEIYKIHGCSTKPNSLILTKKDYDKFNEKNAYLAAKLITLFVEHPIVFIGYSLSDENIKSLLKAISSCIGEQNLDQLRKNLIFVQHQKDGTEESMSDTYVTIDGIQIPLILIKTDNFSQIYEAIDATKRKIPARVLRFCKEQLFELVQSAEPEQKLCVVDIDEIENKEDVEFVVGVGVATKRHEDNTVAKVGYATVTVPDLIHDLLHDDKQYDAQQILEHAIRFALRSARNVPVFKYLKQVGINNLEAYKSSGLALDKCVLRELNDFKANNYSSQFRNCKDMTMLEIIESYTPETAAGLIPFLEIRNIDLEALREFLIENEVNCDYATSNYANNFRKLATFYDKVKFGW